MRSKIRDLLTKLLTSQLQELLRTSRIESFKTKNKKLRNLIKVTATQSTKYTVPIINWSSYHLNQKGYEQLKFGLDHSVTDTSKHTKKNIAAYMESAAYTTSDEVDN